MQFFSQFLPPLPARDQIVASPFSPFPTRDQIVASPFSPLPTRDQIVASSLPKRAIKNILSGEEWILLHIKKSIK